MYLIINLLLAFCLSLNTNANEDFFGDDFALQSNYDENIKLIKSSKQLYESMKPIMETLKNTKANNRLELNRKLNTCEPSKSGSALIIAFSGTGSYQPKLPVLLERVCKSLGPSIDKKILKDIHYHVHNKFHQTERKLSEIWSGLLAGPMNLLCNKPDLLPYSYDWYSFPSEESELLADPAKFRAINFLRLPSEIKDSIAAQPAGIKNAVACTKKFLKHPLSVQDKTKLIVFAHSSGGRSTIKFLEILKQSTDPRSKQKPIKANLVFTIDPVREAHEAMGEAASQMAGNPLKMAYNYLPLLPDVKVQPVYVWSRSQKNSLYKTSNTERHINVYQKADTLGLKMNLKIGIHGSPIHQADINRDMTNKLGNDGHGAINHHENTIQLLEQELKRLYQP